MDIAKIKMIKGRSPLRASSVIRLAIRKRGKSPGSLNFAFCPKIGKDVVFPSDLEFLHGLHLEADERIAAYESDPDRIIAHLGEEGFWGSKPDAITTAHNGQLCMVEVKYAKDLKTDLRAQLQVQAQSKAASAVGMDWRAYTDEDANAEQRLLNDWMHIIVVLGFCHGQLSKALTQRVRAAFEPRRRLTLEAIRDMRLDDWHLVFATVFQLVQRGILTTDLHQLPLSRSTQVCLLDQPPGQ